MIGSQHCCNVGNFCGRSCFHEIAFNFRLSIFHQNNSESDYGLSIDVEISEGTNGHFTKLSKFENYFQDFLFTKKVMGVFDLGRG